METGGRDDHVRRTRSLSRRALGGDRDPGRLHRLRPRRAHPRDAGREPRLLLAGAAFFLAVGIWTMHFVGMLASPIPAGTVYLVLPTIISFLICALVVGISQARTLGYHVTVAAPAADLPTAPDADMLADGFGLGRLTEARRFIVVSTQGRGDEAALRAAVSTDPAYHAFVGSRRKMAALRDKLIAEGIDAAASTASRPPPASISATSPRKRSQCRSWRRSRWSEGEDSAGRGRRAGQNIPVSTHSINGIFASRRPEGRHTNEFAEWFYGLSAVQQDDLTAAGLLLIEQGPHLPFPIRRGLTDRSTHKCVSWACRVVEGRCGV